jgi:hypothetical protein
VIVDLALAPKLANGKVAVQAQLLHPAAQGPVEGQPQGDVRAAQSRRQDARNAQSRRRRQRSGRIFAQHSRENECDAGANVPVAARLRDGVERLGKQPRALTGLTATGHFPIAKGRRPLTITGPPYEVHRDRWTSFRTSYPAASSSMLRPTRS